MRTDTRKQGRTPEPKPRGPPSCWTIMNLAQPPDRSYSASRCTKWGQEEALRHTFDIYVFVPRCSHVRHDMKEHYACHSNRCFER